MQHHETTRRIPTPLALTLAATLFLCAAAANAAAQERPNILWINAEDISPHLGCYGDAVATTPNIDRLAARSVLFRNAFSTAPICSPSRSCLATGLYATALGTQHLRCEVRIPQSVVPLAVRLRELGYYTTNTGKSDYNFSADGIWDNWTNDEAPWRSRRNGQPFFTFITVGQTHEGPTNHQDAYERATADLPDDLRHDPDDMLLPPYYPDTPETRRIFANLYDLITVYDRKVGRVIELLERDGELENTIVFVFSDHGDGLPRSKRWLYDSGLRVPLVVFVPERFRHLTPWGPGTQTARMVSFVDFPATAMSLAGAPVPDIMQGEPFLGTTIAEPRRYVYGARSRADDMFEVSRSVFDGRYLYVRHFMPHLPWIQPGVIFGDDKRSYRELRRLHNAGLLDEHAEALWADHKPVEQLFDLQTDPHELTNLAASPDHAETKARLAAELRRWILDHRDSGFLPEAEYQIRSAEAHITPYEFVQDPARFDLESTLEAAWRVGDESVPLRDLAAGLRHREASVRYWSAVAMQVRGASAAGAADALVAALDDASPSVQIAAAEALMAVGRTSPGLEALGRSVQDVRPWVSLQAARALALLGERSRPLVPEMKKVIDRNRSEPGARRPYKDFNYASFTGWALETALEACGEKIDLTN